MSEPPSPRRTQLATFWILAGVGLFQFLLFAGLSGWQLRHKLNLPETHEPTTAKVEQLSVLCALEKKSGRNWDTEQVVDCDKAKAIVAERSSFAAPWRTTPGQYALLAYTAGGKAYRSLLPVGLLGERQVAAGEELPMFVERSDPQSIERPYEDSDRTMFWQMSGIGLAIGVIVGLIGWGAGSFVRRRQEAALAAGATLTPSGKIVYPQQTPNGQPSLTAPLWAKVLHYVGYAILIVGLLLAALALLGSNADSDVLRGALFIAVASFALWRLCVYVAGLGRWSTTKQR